MINIYKNEIESELKKYFEEYKKNSSHSSLVWDAMEYTTLLGGKRLRGIMCLESANILGADYKNALPLACALEIMHAYSLIHDDLPCMDNDDLRRGKPSNHKVFGEAMALLAGDALISFGAQLIIEKTPETISKDCVLDIVKDYLSCAGAKGIIAGQCADILSEGKKIDFDTLEYIHRYKTGALFKCAILTGAKIANANLSIIKKLEEYSDNFGLLFQIYDDIIDCTLTTEQLGKTANKDALENKLTYVSAYGLEKAKNIFCSLIDKNCDILNQVGIKSDVFNQIYEMLVRKVK